jgi:hypothetical protein
MRRSGWRIAITGLGVIVLLGAGSPAFAQERPLRQQLRQGQPRQQLGLAEIQRLFDAYTVVQAQEALVLDDAQFGRFLPRLRALHDVRRRVEVERQRLTTELGRMLAPGVNVDDTRVREQMRALDDVSARGAADVRAAVDAVDQVLDLRQQARFRVFEQQMERRKLELVMRARRGDAARLPADDRF